MGRQRHARSGRAGAQADTVDRRDGRIRAIKDFHDGAQGEDAFELQDDQVLLDAPIRNEYEEADDIFNNEEEVLALRSRKDSIPSSTDDDDDDEENQTTSSQKSKRKGKASSAHDPVARSKISRNDRPPPVFTQSDSDEDPLEQGNADTPEAVLDEVEDGRDTWGSQYHVSRKEMQQRAMGPSKSKGRKKVSKSRAELDDYMGDSATAELSEALRIQRAQKAALDNRDYGTLSDLGSGDDEFSEPVVPLYGSATHYAGPSFENRDDAVVHLVSTKPYLLSLLSDFQMLSDSLPLLRDNLKQTISSNLKESQANNPSIGVETLQIEYVEQYLVIAAFYFKLVLRGSADTELGRDVFGKLAEFREGIQSLEEAGVTLDPNEEIEDPTASNAAMDSEEEEEDEAEMDEAAFEAMLDAKFMEGLRGDMQSERNAGNSSLGKRKRDQELQAETGTKRKRRVRKKAHKTAAPNLIEKPYVTPSKALLNLGNGSPSANAAADDFVEGPDTPTHDGEKRKRRDLRHHTSQIASTAARRARAVEGRIREGGGDDDVPYISKEAQRREVQRKEAIRMAQQMGVESSRSADVPTQEEDASDEDGYYDLIKASKAARQSRKKDEYDEGRLEDRATLAEIAETDGPRSVTRAILANKGLTPKRAKANRNPRVKKRQSYDKAKKKVSSMKSVFKPQEAAAQRSSAGYHGEKSGIGSKTVKSRKLSG